MNVVHLVKIWRDSVKGYHYALIGNGETELFDTVDDVARAIVINCKNISLVPPYAYGHNLQIGHHVARALIPEENRDLETAYVNVLRKLPQ